MGWCDRCNSMCPQARALPPATISSTCSCTPRLSSSWSPPGCSVLCCAPRKADEDPQVGVSLQLINRNPKGRSRPQKMSCILCNKFAAHQLVQQTCGTLGSEIMRFEIMHWPENSRPVGAATALKERYRTECHKLFNRRVGSAIPHALNILF